AWLVQGGTTGGIANSQLGEAFGVAIWEIVWETDTLLDVTVGNGFRAENVEQSALANQWLDSLDGTGPMADTVALSNNDRQDFVTVPEPASMALLVLGALVLKRKRK
ncbi:MAG: PEP-CTERM sorting domain-containing protein, partial [Anaerohalosphaera sp.]|nr:PEP-CTERM sorting domain-containing protein [Anaerohalosphaera sp.]